LLSFERSCDPMNRAGGLPLCGKRKVGKIQLLREPRLRMTKHPERYRDCRSSKISKWRGKGSAASTSPSRPTIRQAISAASRRRAVPALMQMRQYCSCSATAYWIRLSRGNGNLGCSQVRGCSRTSRELAGTRSCVSSCFERITGESEGEWRFPSWVTAEATGDECDQDARSLAELDTRRRVVNRDHAAFPGPHRPIPY
jgi:hypothetical protein